MTATSLSGGIRHAGWALLASLLAVTLLAALSYDRTDWPSQLAGEATYLMQARSLGEDFDLVYTRADFDRMLLDDKSNPTDLALVTGNGGRRITFDRPFPYALYLAPFLRLWPRQGLAIANALLLVLVSVVAARTLERRIGPWGASWVALLVFASVLFVYVFLATGDLFLFALTALAFCLVARSVPSEPGCPEAGGEAPDARRRSWLAVGALLAIPVATEPLYAVLAVAALFAPPKQDRRAPCTALIVGFCAGFIAQALVGWWAGGGLFGLGVSSFRFTPETGFPLVDFTAAEWPQTVRRLAAFHWDGAPRFSWGLDPRLWWWDLVYLLVGRSIGLLPYFAPVFLLPAVGSLAGYRRPLALAAAAWALGVVVLQPFNLYGGEGAVANRLFLPVYGALWMLIAPVRRMRALAISALTALVLAAPFLWQLWSAPRDYAIDQGRDAPGSGLMGGYRHVTPLARRILPYETSQRPMPGGDAAEHNGLTVKFLSQRGWAETRHRRLMIDGGGPLELMIGSNLPLDVLRFDFGRDAPAEIEVSGGELAESQLKPDGGISFRVLPRRHRRHATWWTPRPQWLYCVTLELPKAGDKTLAFEIQGEQFE